MRKLKLNMRLQWVKAPVGRHGNEAVQNAKEMEVEKYICIPRIDIKHILKAGKSNNMATEFVDP